MNQTTKNTGTISRQDYIIGNATHAEYYGQFVTDTIKQRVLQTFSLDELLASRDKHLNDLPLHRWDRCAGGMGTTLCAVKLKEAGDGPTLAGAVCILKAAARQIIAEKGGTP